MITVNRLCPSARRLASMAPRRFKSAATTPTTAASQQQQATAAAKETTNKTSTTTSSTRTAVQALAAAAAGVATVSVAAALVEQSTAAQVPAYNPRGVRFDQSTFGGRFAQMLLACDPRLLLYSQDQVLQAKALLDRYNDLRQNGSPASPGMAAVSDRALWEAKRVVNSALHPDTGDVIPRPFRMSGYVPFNGPICVASE